MVRSAPHPLRSRAAPPRAAGGGGGAHTGRGGGRGRRRGASPPRPSPPGKGPAVNQRRAAGQSAPNKLEPGGSFAYAAPPTHPPHPPPLLPLLTSAGLCKRRGGARRCCSSAGGAARARAGDGVRYRLPLWAEGVLGPELRLHVQDPHHRQQQRGEDLVPLPVRRRLLHARLRQHRRHRLQGQDHLPERQAHQAADLGHGWAGAVPHHHHRLLPRGHGLHPDVRHHQRGVLQRRAGLVDPDQDVLVGQRAGPAGGEQVRHGGRARGVGGEGPPARRAPGLRVLRGQRQGQHQRQADLRAAGGHHLREDVGVAGHGRPRRHRRQAGPPADGPAGPPAPGLCLLGPPPPPRSVHVCPPPSPAPPFFSPQGGLFAADTSQAPKGLEPALFPPSPSIRLCPPPLFPIIYF